MELSTIAFFCLGLAVGSATIVVTNNQCVGSCGTVTQGYVSLDKGTTLCIDPTGDILSRASVTLGKMSSHFENSTQSIGASSVNLAKGSHIDLGDYSVMEATANCICEISDSGYFQSSPHHKRGKAHVSCNENLKIGSYSYVNVQAQAVFNFTESIQLGDSINLDIYAHSSLQIHNTLQLKYFVWVTLYEYSVFTVEGQGVATVTTTTVPGKYSRVTLKKSARLDVKGTFTVGAGKETEVILDESGRLIILPDGKFLIEADNFTIGKSSFWYIDGSFHVDADSHLSSGIQSNITINKGGTFKGVLGGSIFFGPGSTANISGTLYFNGSVSMGASSQFTIRNSQAQINIYTGASITAEDFAGIDVRENSNVQMTPGSSITIKERGVLVVEPNLFCFVRGHVVVPPSSLEVFVAGSGTDGGPGPTPKPITPSPGMVHCNPLS